MYQKVDTNLNFVDREKKVEEFWKENHIFEKSMENRKEGETYTFYDGPPTANGKPHIGHVLTRVIKDMIPRYRTMKGYMVPDVYKRQVESVFSYPGIGALSYESARYHDYNLLMLLCMMSGILVIFCNIVSQTINEQIDPRMKDEVITEKSEVVEG